MVRFYEIFAVLVIVGATTGAFLAYWSDPSDKVDGVPKDVRSNSAAYRSHYRHVVILGGK